MSDLITQPVASPDVAQIPTPPQPPPVPSDPIAVQRYQELYGTPPVSTPPITPANTQPSEPPASAPGNFGSEEVIQLLNTMKAEIEQLRAAQPPATPTPVATPTQRQHWMDLVRAGKLEEADELLQTQTAERASQLAITQVEQRMATQNFINKKVEEINSGLRNANPDLVDMEDVIASRVEAELLDLQRNNKLQTPEQYVEAYHKAVSKQVDNAKQFIQRIRGAGALQAQTVRTEVLSSTTGQPSARIDAPPSTTSKPKTTFEILEERKNHQLKLRGLGQ
jgi:hypothetical protein